MVPLQSLSFAARSFDPVRVEGARGRPMIVANPSADQDFLGSIDRFLPGASEPHELEARLRTRYPQAVVRRRELAGERIEVWYVYRDGHWIRSEGDV